MQGSCLAFPRPIYRWRQTGSRFTVYRDGKIVEYWSVVDFAAGILAQLSVMPG